MSYNPHNEKYLQLNQAIEQLQRRIDTIQAGLIWRQQFDIAAKQTAYASHNSKWQQQNQQLQSLEQACSAQRQALQQLVATQKTLWNPQNWFNAEERAKRKQKEEIFTQLETLTVQISAQQNACTTTARATQDVLRQLEKYHAIKPELLTAEANQCLEKQQQLITQLQRVKQLKVAADTELAKPLANLQNAKAELARQQQTQQLAASLENRLNNAANSYERKMMHEQSERQLGVSRPASAKQKAERHIVSLKRDIDKIERKLRELQSEHSRDIRILVIDGNNMCYQHGRFIGVQAVKAFITAATAEYAIKVVFDASIRRHLNAGNKAIEAMVDPQNRCQFVHVVATKQAADETILRLATDDQYSYVISNDKYKDYAELACVQQNRVIRHEVVDNRVFVHSLGIETQFTLAATA